MENTLSNSSSFKDVPDLKKFFNAFSDVCSDKISRYILEAGYTSYFSSEMKALVTNLENNFKENIGIKIIFNSKGELAFLDKDITCEFIEDAFELKMGDKLKKIYINNENSLIKDCYKCLYNVMHSIYKEIKFDTLEMYELAKHFKISTDNIEGKVLPLIILTILEETIPFLAIKSKTLLSLASKLVF